MLPIWNFCVKSQILGYCILVLILKFLSLWGMWHVRTFVHSMLVNSCMKHRLIRQSAKVLCLVALVVSACSRPGAGERADRLNMAAYEYRYRNLDSTMVYARRAYDASHGYDDGKAEALNNMAFVMTAKMDYGRARELLNKAVGLTDNQVELLIADIQFMRLCQRQSENKNFYLYRRKALSRMERIGEEQDALSEHQKKRFVYAQSEYGIVTSVYYYYVGLEELSIKAIETIDPNGEIVEDTAQLLNYYYNIGAGGIIRGEKESVCQTEFNYLMRCYLLSRQYNYPYWEANSLQAISEHMQDDRNRRFLVRNNPQEIDFVNVDKMPDSLLAGNLAGRALVLFDRYGDVYQTAGAYRTLAECYWSIRDYPSALICLNQALNKNKAVKNAPDLVASVREQLSLAYAALGDMKKSNYNRDMYLNMQERTRQDRQLEARAEQLDSSLRQLNLMILAVVAMILLVVLLLFVFDYMRRRNGKKYSIEDFLRPLEEWKLRNEEQNRQYDERYEEVEERKNIVRQQLINNKKRNLEQRAKISLSGSIIPLINRMEHEVERLVTAREDVRVREERYEYVAELTAKINEYNDVLTRWIQMRRGELSLHIESFGLDRLFGIVAGSRMEYKLRGIEFCVEPTTEVVKADKVLTLFMINTMAENARRYTPSGGRVMLESHAADDYVEISIIDTGVGIPPEELSMIFSNNIVETSKADNARQNPLERHSHGFGLMNCKGIIDKYRKISSLFNVCVIGVESELGRGSRFYFRLPKGVRRALVVALLMGGCVFHGHAVTPRSVPLMRASAYADSAHMVNAEGNYRLVLAYADSCIMHLNSFYLAENPGGRHLMRAFSANTSHAAELKWYGDSLRTDYDVILRIRNESAIAALALHEWDLYNYNDEVYTKLFRERSADSTLPEYVSVMQNSENNKNVAIIMLVFLFFMIFPAYYILYYRHRIYYNLCVDSIDTINRILLSSEPLAVKMKQIGLAWAKRDRLLAVSIRLQPLRLVVDQIKQTLAQSIKRSEERQTTMDYAMDELRKVEYENDKMHVSNSVLDNCLSTLKHETMYYPSRIRQLIDGTDRNLAAIHELVTYYKELYTILNAQALRQMDSGLHIDYAMVEYLFEILRKLNGGKPCGMEATMRGSVYVVVTVRLESLCLTAEQRAGLFTPLTMDIRFLICMRIVREVGELANARGCGIKALDGTGKETVIEIILTQSVWRNLKL